LTYQHEADSCGLAWVPLVLVVELLLLRQRLHQDRDDELIRKTITKVRLGQN
jgi:hypothetical protein